MGNHRLEHCRFRVSIAPPIVSKVAVVETRKQHAKIGVTQSLDVGITITRVETIFVPNINVIKRGVLIRSVTKLGSGSSGVLAIRNLSQSLTLPTTTIGIVGIPQVVFTNWITTTHVNKTTNRPLMNSMVAGGYRSANVVHPRGGYENQLL